jgi:hypothetical protein
VSNALARRFKVDVSTDGSTWVPLKGLTDFNPQENATLQAANDYDSNGFESYEKTLTGVKVSIKARRVLNAGAFDPGQELARATWLQFGTAARLYMRFYDRNGASQAFSGLFLVDYQQSKTGVADIEEVGITFTADGIVSSITNPALAAQVATIISATPSGAATGAMVRITGAYFTGVAASGVKFGATACTSIDVISDSVIEALMPTGSAGAANITVVNGAGTSAAFTYTRG